MMPMDPISGNAVPTGALPKEVRDDQPIMASEGEYIIPANVVRYLGLEKIEAMINKAKEGLKEKAAQGRIGGQPMEDDAEEAPEREGPPVGLSAPPVAPPGAAPRGMAEGGVVANTTTLPKMVKFTGPDGQSVFIPFVNGNPIITIPQGYTPAPEQTPKPTTPAPTTPAPATQGSNEQRRTGDEEDWYGKLGVTPIEEWDVDKFIQLGTQLENPNPIQSGLSRVANNIVPGGRILSRITANYRDRTVPTLLDNMIESGVDRTGAALTEDQLKGLVNTREVMRDRAAADTGASANPFERVSDFFGRIFGGGQEQAQAPAAPTQAPAAPSTSGDGDSFSADFSTATAAPDKAVGAAEGSSKSEGAWKPSSTPVPTSMPSYPDSQAYRKGGLVTRRTKPC